MNQEAISLKLKQKILPIYKDLLAQNSFKNVCVFAAQWGREYPQADNAGLLFVGRAVNGWITNNTDIDYLFAENNDDRIFNRSDQIEWVYNNLGNKVGYNTKKSAFWRLIIKVAKNDYADDWYKKIAWSNIYKIAKYNGGNPGRKLQAAQRENCIKILEQEIKVLAPEYVIMLTSDWEAPFIARAKQGKAYRCIKTYKWDKYQTSLIKIDKVKYIISHHPQGKKERAHAAAIIKLIEFDRSANRNDLIF